jgi:hypothetical protein
MKNATVNTNSTKATYHQMKMSSSTINTNDHVITMNHESNQGHHQAHQLHDP